MKGLAVAKGDRGIGFGGAWGGLDLGRAFPGAMAHRVPCTGPGFLVSEDPES